VSRTGRNQAITQIDVNRSALVAMEKNCVTQDSFRGRKLGLRLIFVKTHEGPTRFAVHAAEIVIGHNHKSMETLRSWWLIR